MNMDYVYRVEHITEPGETQKSSDLTVYNGGKGLNQSVALGRAGVFVYHAGNVGPHAESLLQELAEANVDTTLVRRLPDEPTGHTVILLDDAGENAITVCGGANQLITSEQIANTFQYFGEGDVLLLQNETNALKDLMAAAVNHGMRVVFNPSPIDDDLLSLPLDTVDTFVVNEVEAAALSGGSPDEPEDMLNSLREMFPTARVVMTTGGAGSWYDDGNERFHQEALPVDVVDTTGAGDTFLGYYLAGRLEGMAPRGAMALAGRAAALAVGRPGAAPSIPTRAQVDAT